MKIIPAQRSTASPVLALLAGAIPAGVTALVALRARQPVTPAAAIAFPAGTASPRAGVDAAKNQVDGAVRSLMECTGIAEVEARSIVLGWVAPKLASR
jgi:hypothetical protein